MELTKSELASHIQKLNCLYVSYTDKMISHMEIGHCDFECMYNKAWLVKSYINILKRFYADGQTCSDCTVIGNTYYIPKMCGYDSIGNIFLPFTPDYTCYFESPYPDADRFEAIRGIYTYGTDGYITGTTIEEPAPYTYNTTTKVLSISFTGELVVDFNVVFSSDCLSNVATITTSEQPSAAFFTIPIDVEIGQIFYVNGVQINNAFVVPFGSSWEQMRDLFEIALLSYGAGFTLGDFQADSVPFTLYAPVGVTTYNNTTVEVDNGIEPVELIGYMSDSGSVDSGGFLLSIYQEQTNSSNFTCSWKENCHTEETINKIIKHAYSLMDTNCNCN